MADIKVRVGQQNSVKVLSSISGSSGGRAVLADISSNVIGGIASVSQLNVSGLSTFVGVATFKNDVYISGNLYLQNQIEIDTFSTNNANISGILTVGSAFYYPPGQPYGVAYFDQNDLLVSTGTTAVAITETNYILSTNNLGVPTWSSVIDGGEY